LLGLYMLQTFLLLYGLIIVRNALFEEGII
jgi:hypothetical protein